MEETKRRRFIIRAVLEGEVDVQEQPQPVRVPLYEWDFTQSLIDTKQSAEATIAGSGIERTSAGLVYSGPQASCFLGANVFQPGHTLEVDIASMERTTTQHGRLIMFTDSSVPTVTEEASFGFILRNVNPKAWAFYRNSWSNSYSFDQNLFDGKTLKFKYYYDENDSKYHSVVYSGDELVGDYSNAYMWNRNQAAPVFIGSYGQAYFNMTITGARIYEGVE